MVTQECKAICSLQKRMGVSEKSARVVPPPSVRLAARVLWRNVESQCIDNLEDHWSQRSEAEKSAFATQAVMVREYLLNEIKGCV
jgi:hypothetical protein